MEQFPLLTMALPLTVQPDAVCFDAIFSHGSCCFLAVMYWLAFMAVRCNRFTYNCVPATIIGSSRGDDAMHMKYTRNGHQIGHHASLQRALCAVPNLQPTPVIFCSLSHPRLVTNA